MYRRAIGKHVRKGDTVVDLGTGTGVLAMFAARAGAGVVHAIEYGPIIDAAQAVARDNGIDRIRFHRIHSRSFTLDKPADVIVHEQIGEAAFDEHVIANLSDLRDRIMRPGGALIPWGVPMFIEPIPMRAGSRIPFSYEQGFDGISFRSLKAVADAQPLTYRYKTERRLPVDCLLCDPRPVVVIDFQTARPGDLPDRVSYERKVAHEGSFDGFCVYFPLDFDDDISSANSPDRGGVSWANAMASDGDPSGEPRRRHQARPRGRRPHLPQHMALDRWIAPHGGGPSVCSARADCG